MWKLVLILAGTTLGAGYVSAHLWQQLRTERDRTEILQARVAELESAQAPRVPHPFTPPAQAFPPPPPDPQQPQQPNAPRKPEPARAAALDRPPPQGPLAAFNAMRLDMTDDPEYREAVRAQNRLMLPQSYPDLAKELNLTAQEADALFDLLAEHQLKSMESSVQIRSGTQVDEAAMRETQRKWQEVRNENEAELVALLGNAKYRDWQEYQQTMGARHQVNQLRSLLSSSGNPLSDDQARPLIDAIHAEQQRQMNETRAMSATQGATLSFAPAFSTADGVPVTPESHLEAMEENLNRTTEANRRLRDAAASYLSPQQLEQFEQMLDQQVTMQRVHLRMQRAQMKQRADAQ